MINTALPHDLKQWTKLSLGRYGLQAGRRLGQHFLVDRTVLKNIITTAQLTPQSRVLEVGGGLGVLTLELMSWAHKVVVVELDKNLSQALRNLALGNDKLKIISADILKVTSAELKTELRVNGKQNNWQIVANLPYEITGAFMQRFLWGDFLPQSLTLLVQREVAERMAAPPGKMSLLSLSCQLKSNVKLVRHIPPAAFWPPPKVQSSLVRLELFTETDLTGSLAGQSPELLWRLARIGFSARRKVLVNNLAGALSLSKVKIAAALSATGLSPTVRAQELSVSDWLRLVQEFSHLK